MNPGKSHLPTEITAFPEFRLGLTREANDNISGNRRFGHCFPDERDSSLVVSSGLPYQEIARIAGTSVANVKVRVHRARVKIKKIMNKGDL